MVMGTVYIVVSEYSWSHSSDASRSQSCLQVCSAGAEPRGEEEKEEEEEE
jgi:hypothetical protein